MAATDVLLADALQRDPTRPLLTFYDDATGERVELSATTLAGWVAKTAGLAQDELAVEPGDSVAVLLPAHWQTAAILLACWSVGAVLVPEPASAAAVFCDEPHLADVRAAKPGEIVALSLAPLGRPFTRPPEGALDYSAVVPSQPDVFIPYADIAGDVPAFRTNTNSGTAAEVVEESRASARRQGISSSDRVLTTRSWNGFADWRDDFLAPLAAGASIVLCANADPAALDRRADTERATIVLTSGDTPNDTSRSSR
ncbi:MAG TPA: TIGR03089 family protein [Mycobacteriales bacterium]|jgi:uncharacterized protein (TIGR03089 family)|nr:TIGR03089 family protein [Mycobacteriales bacterium]